MHNHERFFVITGGPGSGKSTLIAALAETGLAYMPEAGRAVIQEQVAAGGTALPWADPFAFAEKMLERDIAAWHAARNRIGPVIFDRGIPDVLGYLKVTGRAIPPHIEQAAMRYRYNRRVFIAPPWREIFAQDAERKQTFAEAEVTYRVMQETYAGLDYELITLPLTSVEERGEFIRAAIAQAA